MLKKLTLLLPVLICASVIAASAASVRVKADKTPMRASASPTAAVVLELEGGHAARPGRRRPRLVQGARPPVEEGRLRAGCGGRTAAGTRDSGGRASAQKPPAGGPEAASLRRQAGGRRRAPPKKGDWTDRGYFVGERDLRDGRRPAFTQTQSWPSFAETATVNVEYPAKNAAGVDIEGGFRRLAEHGGRRRHHRRQPIDDDHGDRFAAEPAVSQPADRPLRRLRRQEQPGGHPPPGGVGRADAAEDAAGRCSAGRRSST